MTTKTTQRHFDAIRAGEVTGANVRGMKMAINAYERQIRGYGTGMTAPQLSGDDMNELEHLIRFHRPRVVGKLHDTGKALLQSRRYARRLESVAHIVADLDHFKLMGFEYLDETHVVPVYRAYDSDGNSFPFRNVPWQSGGDGPELLPQTEY